MLEIEYGEKGFASRAWKEIEAGRPVALKVVGSKRQIIIRALSLYAEHDRLSREGGVSRGLLLRLAWQTFRSSPFIGLCNHGRSAGMTVAAYEKENLLEIKFEKPKTTHLD